MEEEFYSKEYEQLKQSRTSYPVSIDIYRKEISDYFNNILGKNVLTIKKNINNVDNIYTGNLKDLDSRLLCWPTDKSGKSEIYIDSDFVKNNKSLCDKQITHELLHSLCYKSGYQMIFGHPNINDSSILYIGISEAVTQMITEDITGDRLTCDVDFIHYYIKNIIRVMSVIFDKKMIVSQYIADSTDFEDKYNQLFNKSFDSFVKALNNIYLINCKSIDSNITKSQIDKYNKSKELLALSIKRAIKILNNSQPNIIEEIHKEVNDEDFLNDLFYEKKGKVKQKSHKKNNR